MQTPHISLVQNGTFAKTVLMPGDPKREHCTYRHHPVSVMASGMGMPSIGIYSYELYHFFGVESIIRVGSAGGIGNGVALRDVVPCDYPVTVCGKGRLVLVGVNETLEKASGCGLIVLEDSSVAFAPGTAFTGSVSGGNVTYR